MRLFDDDTPSLNDGPGAQRNFPEGEDTVYQIGSMTLKNTKEGEAFINLTAKNAAGESFGQPLFIASQNEVTRRIAKGTVKALWDACKLSGNPTTEMLPNFAKKFFKPKVEHGEANGKVFANFRRIDPADGFGTAVPAKQYHQPEDKDDTIPMQHATDPAPAAPPPPPPPPPSGGNDWRSLMKGREAPVPAPTADPAPM